MRKTNKEYAESNEEFKEACKRANIPPTTRQASRWRMQTGKAWKFREIRKEAP